MAEGPKSKLATIADILIIIGLIGILIPLIWSCRTDILQAKELARFYASNKSAVPTGMPGALIIIPKLGLKAAIVEETKVSDLDRGPMHLRGTGIPGYSGNCCIAAHKEKWFRGLRRLKKGDFISVITKNKRYVYIVTGGVITRADNLSVLNRTPVSTVTLITCTGPAYFGRGNGRLVIQGMLRYIKPQQ